MLIDKPQIESLIPQRYPFVMIDQLIDATEKGFESAFEITSSNLFLENNLLSESALIENIAQTCAAGFGYLGQQEAGGQPRIGYIGAVTQVSVLGQAALGNQLNTRVTILSTFDTIHLVEGKVSCGDQELLTCQLKIVLA
jgi:3-hydroxymyristoyl/3-hydroxydecanoyl-(acyl carrier protein) dehydratase